MRTLPPDLGSSHNELGDTQERGDFRQVVVSAVFRSVRCEKYTSPPKYVIRIILIDFADKKQHHWQ